MTSLSKIAKAFVQQAVLNPVFKICNEIDFKKCMSDPEYTHDAMTNLIRKYPDNFVIHSLFDALSYKSENLRYTRKNQHKDLEFENPILYAAGSNKYADGTNYFDKLFGGLMIGGITAEERAGNGYEERDVIKSLPVYESTGRGIGKAYTREEIVKENIRILPRVGKDTQGSMTNRFGLNNLGAKATAEKISRQKHNDLWTQKPVGINVALGTGDMVEKYPVVVKTLYEHGDFFELNFSCPNHKGLSEVQSNVELIRKTIQAVKKVNIAQKPLVVKFGILSETPDNMSKASDLTYEALAAIITMCCEELNETQDKINITNTAKEHTGYNPSKELRDKDGNIVGGMSGKLIQERSLQTVQFVKKTLDENSSKLGVIGTGGIGCDKPGEIGKQLIAMQDAGAELFNMFTGFVYNPVSLPKNLKALDIHIDDNMSQNISEIMHGVH